MYVDQFLVSEYAHLIVEGASRWSRLHDHQRKALSVIARLSACQLIVCPESEYHRRESIRDSRYAEFRKAYESLSDRAHWRQTAEIEAIQAYRHASGWIRHEEVTWDFPRDEALIELPAGWAPLMDVSVDMGGHDERRAEAENAARNSTNNLAAIAERWRRAETTFDRVFQEEASQACHTHLKYGRIAVDRHRNAIARGDPEAPLLGSV